MFSLKTEARKIVRSMTKCCDCIDVDMSFDEAINSYSHTYEYSHSESTLLQVLAASPHVASAFLNLLNKHKGKVINFNLVNDAIYRSVLEKYGECTLTEIMTK